MFFIDCTANKESPQSTGGERPRNRYWVSVSGPSFHKREMSLEVWKYPTAFFTSPAKQWGTSVKIWGTDKVIDFFKIMIYLQKDSRPSLSGILKCSFNNTCITCHVPIYCHFSIWYPCTSLLMELKTKVLHCESIIVKNVVKKSHRIYFEKLRSWQLNY